MSELNKITERISSNLSQVEAVITVLVISVINNPILTQRDLPADRKDPITSAGHAQFVEGPDGKMYAIFLAVRPYEGNYYNTGRETFIVPVEWKDGWPIANPDYKEIQYNYEANFKEVKMPDARPQSGNFEYKVTFEKELDPTFLFMRTVDSSSYSLTSKNGLTLKLKPETVMELGNPSFIGKRQQHIYCTAEIALAFSTSSADEKAGLIIFQDEKHFYYLSQSVDQGKPVIQLFAGNEESKMSLLVQAPLQGKSKQIYLRIDARGGSYDFYYALKPNKWTVLKKDVDGKFLSTQVAGGFIGCLFGMYATSSGKQTTNSAMFEYLRYSGNDPIYQQTIKK